MLNLVIFTLTGHAKLAKLYWEVWTGEPTDTDCPSNLPPTHYVDCEVGLYGDAVTCDMMTEYPPDICLPFPDSGPTDQWWIECEQDPNDNSMVPFMTLVSNSLGKLHGMKLTCEDAPALLGKDARSASDFKVGASNLGVSSMPAEPLGSAPAPSPSGGKHPHLVEYIVIPIVAAIVLALLCGVSYCACAKSKTDTETDKGPFQATPNPGETPIDEDDEKVHQFILSDGDPHVVTVKKDPVLAMGNDVEEEEKPKKKGFFSKVSFFGKKKTKTPDNIELGENVGYQAKSGKIPTGDPNEVAEPEEPLTGSLTTDAPSDSKASDGPAWGDDQPLEVKTCADASDATAGYPVLESKTAPSNNLF